MLYAILCYHDEELVGSWTKEEDDAVLAKRALVTDRLAGEGKLGPVARLMPTTSAVTVRSGSEPLVLDGPFAETKEQLLGFYLVDCASLEEAIAAAREMLLRPDLAASQEGAWLLARSYDPSYLATIQSPDASADQQQAEEWYRRWRDIAVRNGMVMDDLRLKRIINSMRSFEAGNNSPPAELTSPGQNR